MAAATMSAATVATTMTFTSRNVQKRERKVLCIRGMKSNSGRKAQNNRVASLGFSGASEQSFGKTVEKLRMSKNKTRGGRNALTTTRNAAVEIFRIAAVMNALTLVGVAVGFVLLRIEASVEGESD